MEENIAGSEQGQRGASGPAGEASQRTVGRWIWGVVWTPLGIWVWICKLALNSIVLARSSFLGGFKAGWAASDATPGAQLKQELANTLNAAQDAVELMVVSDSEADAAKTSALETAGEASKEKTNKLCIEVPFIALTNPSDDQEMEWNPAFQLGISKAAEAQQDGASPPSSPTSPLLDVPSSPDRPSFSRSSSVSSSSSWASEHSGSGEMGAVMVRVATSINEEHEEDEVEEDGDKKITLTEHAPTLLSNLIASSSNEEDVSWDTALAWINSACAGAASSSRSCSPLFAGALTPPPVIISEPEESSGLSKACYAWFADEEVEFDETRLGPFSVFGVDRSDVLEDYYAEEDDASASWCSGSVASGSWALTEDEEGYDEFGAMPDWCDGAEDPFSV